MASEVEKGRKISNSDKGNNGEMHGLCCHFTLAFLDHAVCLRVLIPITLASQVLQTLEL